MRVVRPAAEVAGHTVPQRELRSQDSAAALEPRALDQLRAPLKADAAHHGRGERPVQKVEVVVRVVHRGEPLVRRVVDRLVQLLRHRDASAEQVAVQVGKLAHPEAVRGRPGLERVAAVVDHRQEAAHGSRPHQLLSHPDA